MDAAAPPLLQLDADAMTTLLRFHAQILVGFIAVLWTLELVDSLILRGNLNRYGIRPRTVEGLRGILVAPLLHGNLRHLATNTFPLLILGWFVMLQGVRTFAIVTAAVWLTSGLGAWLLGGSRSNHIGASGLIFGYLGFLVARGYFEQSVIAIALAVIAGFLYGGMVWGVLPIRRGRSWQGHLFGLVGGGVMARFLPDIQQWLQP